MGFSFEAGHVSVKFSSSGFPKVKGELDALERQLRQVQKSAQGILDARAKYPDSSLADLYDELTMPPELRKAHKENDKAVLKAYGLKPDTTEEEIVAFLMKRYQELVK